RARRLRAGAAGGAPALPACRGDRVLLGTACLRRPGDVRAAARRPRRRWPGAAGGAARRGAARRPPRRADRPARHPVPRHARALLERGDEVRVLDNFSTGNRANLEGLDVEIVEGELRSYERVHNATRRAEVVYHLGALGSVPRSVQDPLTSNAVNVEGTMNVLLAARDEGVGRVVFSSSSSVYGSKRELPVTESLLADPISPYGVAKLAAERYCVSFSRVYESFE